MTGRKQRSKSKRNLAEVAAPLTLGATIFLTLVAVDTGAQASFDAPKRLVAMLGLAVLGVIAATSMRPSLASIVRWRFVGLALGAAAVLTAVSTAFSPHRDVAVRALGPILLFAALFTISCVTAKPEAMWAAARKGFVAGALVNAGLSLMQLAGMPLFAYASLGGRRNISALVGNDAILGLVLALAMVALAPALRIRGSRLKAAAALVLLAAGLVASSSFTAIAAAAVGLMVVFAPELRRKPSWTIAGICLLLVAGASVVMLRSSQIHDAVRTRDIDAMLSYRLAPWSASLMMIGDRPFTGYGPGTFALEFTPHRIEADAAFGRRYVSAKEGSYAEAHSDVLQAAAEIGIPAALLFFAAVAAIFLGLLRGGERGVAVAGVLAALAVAALTWFPLHHPAMAMLGIAAAGRGWSLAAEGERR